MQNNAFISPLAQVPRDILAGRENRLEEKVRVAQTANGEDRKAQLKKVSQEFEAIFIAQLLKVMRETIEESGLTEGGFGKSIYTELFDQEVALNMARQGALGISDLMYRNLAEDHSTSRVSPESNPEISLPESVPAPSAQPGDPEISDLQLPMQMPISSGFGLRRDPFSHQVRFHKGLDFAAPEGMKVLSALPGKVISAGYERGYGNTVVLQHARGVQTRYGHLGAIWVKPGDVLDSEAELGTVGNTGRSTGPHLHFEVIRMGTPVNPLSWTGSQLATSKQRAAILREGS